MRSVLRSLRRAPGRVVASVLAVALAVGAIGVFAIPTVASGTLRELAARDRLAHLIVATTAVSPDGVAAIEAVEGVEAVEVRPTAIVESDAGDQLRLVAFDPTDQDINLVSAREGRLPGPGEAVVSPGLATLGDTITIEGTELDVVGIGGTAWWSDTDAVFVSDAGARALLDHASSMLLVRMDAPSQDALDAVVPTLREVLAADGARLLEIPELLADGRHPIEDDLVQISTMIGLLGVVAGVVALVLLASTASALITDRTREVAVMRALGAKRRPLRRRLRRLALATAALGLVVGLPIGVAVSNLIARMVLERFVGVTPAVAISWPVVAGSAAFALGGSRIVASRAARRVTRRPLAEGLRDRSTLAWGWRWSDRVVSRLSTGGLLERLALRNNLRARARTVSTVAQIAAGTGAIIIVASLVTSVNAFNEGETEPWAWEEIAYAVEPGLSIEQAEVRGVGVEAGIEVVGNHDGWEVDVVGLDPDTVMLDRRVEHGRWLSDGRGVVVAQGFAEHRDMEVGDTISVELAPGDVEYEVVGFHRSRSRDIYVPIDTLADDLGAPDRANLVFAAGEALPAVAAPVDTVTLADLNAEDAAAREAILAIFGAVGATVAAVSALGVASLLAVSMFERRHEVATLLAVGGRRRDVRRALLLELVPLAGVGALMGVAVGWFGATWIMGAFEQANAVDLGVVFASGAVLPTGIGAIVIVGAIAVAAARRASSVPAAVTLRGAS